ncbi:ABC transporter C family member 3 [Neonectria ditissima]|uniref:ABC transporter C family member 3 n=1 Tax=Neonectria ditissima TaxID=78410 RepID=A0A0P7AZZ3_9HYPO|nr:ABC transporter C family member 3 [Neonectria ditissima]
MACSNDNTFGPVVDGCRGEFDFTLKFQDIILSIVPSSVFLVLGLGRLIWLIRKPRVITGKVFEWLKIAAIAVLAIVQLVQLVYTCQGHRELTAYSIASDALRLVAVIAVGLVSFAEHSRSPRPSILLGCFLLLTLLFDVVRSRTLWLLAESSEDDRDASISVTATAVKAVIILLEARPKMQWRIGDEPHSPEEMSGIFGLSTYFWLRNLFFAGFRSLLSIADLYAFDQRMKAPILEEKMTQRQQRNAARAPPRLFPSLVRTLATPLLLPVAPRLAMIGFTFCQPFLIETLLTYLETTSDPDPGYGLIGAAFFIYTGVAVSNALYSYWQERFVCMIRGVLVNAVYRKTIALPTAVAADSAALTLMNSDVERVQAGFLPLHEYWANVVEVALACWLLEKKIGTAFVAPIVVVILCVIASAGVAAVTGRRQFAWMKAIEERVAATATTIASMRALRVSGMTSAVEQMIQGLREKELKIGGRWRLMLVFAATLAFTPITISPLMAFAVTSRTLGVTRIFPAMAYMTLLAMPLSSLFQNIPNLISAFTCLGRIDDFLKHESRVDPRAHADHLYTVEKTEKPPPAFSITQGRFGWVEGKDALEEMDLTIPASALTIIIGPVASGKSTLLKALLGETTYFSGTMAVAFNNRKIGYCDQTPFLPNGTIRSIIVGHAGFNAARYHQALEAAALLPDLAALPQGDLTRVGGSGVSLSGGQKQRISLARALFLDTSVYLFDEILSGLDASTSSQVFQRALGPQGLLAQRGATVIWCTHNETYLRFADHVIALGENGSLVGQGSFADLVAQGHLTTDLQHDTESHMAPEEVSGPLIEQAPRPAIAEPKVSEKSRQIGDFTVYRYYFTSISNWAITVFVFACCCYGFTSNFPTVWLKYWSEDMVRPSPTRQGDFYIGIYGLLQTTCLLSLMVIVIICTQAMIAQSGSVLHQAALRTVTGAPLRFFTTTDAGTVTNLFAQDMTLIDSQLPFVLANFSASLISSLGMSAVIAIASPWLAVSYPVLIAVVYIVQLFYLRTSRQLRLLDLEAKAPLYSHFIDTLAGLPTLRALGHIDAFIATSGRLLDDSQRPAYLLAMIQRWLQLVLRLIVAALAVIIVSLATQLRTDSGFTGATLVTLMGFGEMLSTLVQSYTALETSIGAVARLKTFSTTTESEAGPDEDVIPDLKWPEHGQIEVQGVSASYSSRDLMDLDDLALRDLSVVFNPGEHAAVFGRTGSGKSSLILLLLRLIDPLSGKSASRITIDGLSIHNIHRDTLRRRLIAVSQEQVFLPASSTIRCNLDPTSEMTDPELHAVLALHDLKFLISDPEASGEPGGLDALFTSDSLSQGQKQLFNLARAVVRRRVRSRLGAEGGVLLLDEVSSSVDSQTEETMLNIIRDEFQGYTVIMVAHRLELAMKCDRVIVMDGGRLGETGRPDELKAKAGGLFKALWDSHEAR